MKRLYVSRPIPLDLLERLRAVLDVTSPEHGEPPTEAQLLAELPGHDAALVQLTEPVTTAVLEAGARRGLSLVAQVAVGLDNIDLSAARRVGVAVTHTPGVLTDATADLAMALMLATCRRIPEAERYVRQGRWGHWSLDLMCGLELRGATLGILGFGRIGRAVAQRAEAFGMRVQWTDAHAGVPLAELLATSDVLSLHAPLRSATRWIIDREALFAMKPGAILINTARGALVEEQAIVPALEEGPLRAVGLDVYEDEPRLHPALLGRDDVILLPHIGSATTKTRHRMAELATESVRAWLDGAPIPNRAV
jgi:glyoxylate reductase